MILCAALALASLGSPPPTDLGWERLTIPACLAKARSLPVGHGECVDIPIFDGAASFLNPQGEESRLAAVKELAGLLHARGYRVAGVVNCFQWFRLNITTTPGVKDILEHQQATAYLRTPVFNLVSPFSARVRKVVLTYFECLMRNPVPADVVVVRFQMPSWPLLVFGVDSRRASIAALGLDPIDLSFNASPPDPAATDYMRWRLNESSNYLSETLKACRKAMPRVPILMRGDPIWAFESPVFRGEELGDWPYALGHGLVDGIVVRTSGSDSGPKNPNPYDRLSRLAATLSSLNSRRAMVWIEQATQEKVPSSVLKQFASTSTALRLSSRQDETP